LYRSPNGNVSVFLEKLEELSTFFSRPCFVNFSLVFGGDLNSDFDVTTEKDSVLEFRNILRQFNFSIHNHKPTRGLACLDNIFSNVNSSNVCCNVSDFSFSDHDCVWVSLYNLVPNSEPITKVGKIYVYLDQSQMKGYVILEIHLVVLIGLNIYLNLIMLIQHLTIFSMFLSIILTDVFL
jgi:hypothetical protein